MYDSLKITPKTRGYQVVFNHTNFHLYHYAGNNPIKYTDPDGRKIIIGITTSDTLWGTIVGEHAFIMCIDEKDPKKSIMLDASGQYGEGRSSDVIDGYQADITIQDYLEYWDTEEKLTTFELILTPEDEKKLKDAISKMEGYSWLECAKKASEILNEYLSKEIKKTKLPSKLLKTLMEYAKKHNGKVIIKNYDFKTNTEIKNDDSKSENKDD